MKLTDKQKKKLAEEALSDGFQEAWENKELGTDPKHVRKHIPPKGMKKSLPTSIRLPQALAEELKKLAAEEGLAYQTYLKMILTKHVKEKNKEAS